MIKTILLRALIIIVTWPILFVIYFGLAALGLIVVAVALKMKVDMTKLPIWGNPKGLDWWKGSPYWWYAIRNPTGSVQLLLKQPEDVTIWGHAGNLEDKEGIQWQYKYAGWMDEFRVTFGKPDKQKGKDEILIGWKYTKEPGIAWTWQMRPAWLAVFPLALLTWGVWQLIL